MISTYASGTQTATLTTEHSLSAPNVQGKFSLWLDTAAMVAGDVLEVRIYKIAIAGGTKRLVGLVTYYGAQPTGEIMKYFGPFPNSLTDTNALQFTITQTLGTGRAYPWLVNLDDALAPTTSSRTLDVSAGGEAGVDWANVGSPTTTLNLSGTTVKTATDVEADTVDLQARMPAALTAGGNIKADVLAISGDATSADNLEAATDGNTYNVGGGAVVVASVTGNVGGNLVGTLSTTERAAIADKILGRRINSGADGTRTVAEALAVLRNKVARSGSTITVYDIDDTTPLFTIAITTLATAEPIVSADPA